ncbi:hypothetical protein BP5796_05716 [Coleophoma crateriformis]|uniref:Uncharacterized protein n=1 Tax=Coleophoma crateriformis TaxID=565419 RepID=A0A3D8RVH1_9HELO|nr:hypothetical protein BP5796_05716 [Coleophoma crateriformis]
MAPTLKLCAGGLQRSRAVYRITSIDDMVSRGSWWHATSANLEKALYARGTVGTVISSGGIVAPVSSILYPCVQAADLEFKAFYSPKAKEACLGRLLIDARRGTLGGHEAMMNVPS